MSYQSNRSRWVYPYCRTNKTEQMIEKLNQRDWLPFVIINDSFLNIDMQELSKYKPEFIEEWYRTAQILLFENFQHSIKEWMEVAGNIKSEAVRIRKNRIIYQYYHKRLMVVEKSEKISCETFKSLPDEVLQHIWSYTDNETRIKYFMGKYPVSLLNQKLNALKCPILKIIYQKTCFCYQGHAMKKELLSYHKKIPPSSHLNKNEKINEIVRFLTNMDQCYEDEKVILTYHQKGTKIRHIQRENSNTDDSIFFSYPYEGTVYPLRIYEKNALELWKQVVVAFHHFSV